MMAASSIQSLAALADVSHVETSAADSKLQKAAMASLRRCLTFHFLTGGKRHFSSSSLRLSTESPVGFIGLGNMGGHMARNLLRKGYPVVVCDVNKEAVAELKNDGASVASTPAEVASGVNKLVTMLPATQHVEEVYTGNNGIFGTVKSGTLMIDSSTIDVAASQLLSAKASKKGLVLMDAPVSGGVIAARDAGLTFMVGGPETSFGEAKALLDNMGKNVIHCGAAGSGLIAKICNNMLLAISMIGVSETMNLGMRMGLDPKMLAKILNMSTGRCWSSELYNPVPGVVDGVPSGNDYKGGFGTALMCKDLGLAQNAANATASPTPLGSHALNIYKLMINSGLGLKDFSSAFLFLQEHDKKNK